MVYELSRYEEDQVLPRPLSEEELAINRRFWEELDESLLGTLPSLINKSDKAAALVSHLCSVARDYWGVAVQRNSQWEEAATHFTKALELNEDNVAAQINLEYNRQYLNGNPDGLKVPKIIEDKFGRYRTWDQVISENGPFDEPSFCFRQGMVFARGGLIRQAAVQFHRVSELNPSNIVARLRYAHAVMSMRRLELADSEIKAIRALDGSNPLDATNQINLIITEASLEVGRTNLGAAERIILDGVAQHPNSMFMLESAMQFYAVQGDATNAATMLEKQLQVNPGSISALVNLGAMKIRMEDFESALPHLNQVLQADPENRVALLNRAIALLQLDRLEAAREDYLALAEIMPNSHRIHFGLAEVAYRQKNTREAIKHYEAYLELPFNNPAETQTAQERLAELKGGKTEQ
jgi:tetratricopeptide (TPR) repeat protein